MTPHTPPVGAKPGQFYYFINLNERGCFYADVRDKEENTVYEIFDTQMVEDGYLKHMQDITGLHHYLTQFGILPPGSTMGRGQ